MRTTKGLWRWALACAVVLCLSSAASAIDVEAPGVTTDRAASIVILPKVQVEPAVDDGLVSPGGAGGIIVQRPAAVDTFIQVTNVSEHLVGVYCFYINANGHCGNAFGPICNDVDFHEVCNGLPCVPGWQETDFRFSLTKRQPLSWSANDGLPTLPLATMPGMGIPPQFNEGSIPPVQESPFIGELKCFQVDPDSLDEPSPTPVGNNELKAEATILRTLPYVDARKYNAIGIPAVPDHPPDPSNVLNLGPCHLEGDIGVCDDIANYNSCPAVLTLDHFFEGAHVITHAGDVNTPVNSTITLVPCSQDLSLQVPGTATVQFLIYNEFEQRFSASTKLQCFKSVRLADIDTRPGPDGDAYSIFSIGTQGTLTGQSRLRPVAGPIGDENIFDANSILGILEEAFLVDRHCIFDGVLTSRTCDLNSDCPTDNVADCQPGVCAGDPERECDSNDSCGTFGPCKVLKTDAANIHVQGVPQEANQIILPRRGN